MASGDGSAAICDRLRVEIRRVPRAPRPERAAVARAAVSRVRRRRSARAELAEVDPHQLAVAVGAARRPGRPRERGPHRTSGARVRRRLPAWVAVVRRRVGGLALAACRSRARRGRGSGRGRAAPPRCSCARRSRRAATASVSGESTSRSRLPERRMAWTWRWPGPIGSTTGGERGVEVGADPGGDGGALARVGVQRLQAGERAGVELADVLVDGVDVGAARSTRERDDQPAGEVGAARSPSAPAASRSPSSGGEAHAPAAGGDGVQALGDRLGADVGGDLGAAAGVAVERRPCSSRGSRSRRARTGGAAARPPARGCARAARGRRGGVRVGMGSLLWEGWMGSGGERARGAGRGRPRQEARGAAGRRGRRGRGSGVSSELVLGARGGDVEQPPLLLERPRGRRIRSARQEGSSCSSQPSSITSAASVPLARWIVETVMRRSSPGRSSWACRPAACSRKPVSEAPLAVLVGVGLRGAAQRAQVLEHALGVAALRRRRGARSRRAWWWATRPPASVTRGDARRGRASARAACSARTARGRRRSAPSASRAGASAGRRSRRALALAVIRSPP